MCGLVGAFSTGNLIGVEREIFEDLLHADVLRGKDSFGVIHVDPTFRAGFYKIAGVHPLAHMEDSAEYRKFYAAPARALIGHNRSATKGKVSSKNAHPFCHKHVTLVHNGTLREAIGTFEVDSEWLTHQIANSKDVPATLGDINGAYALIWFDSQTETINIARNSERPLAIARVSNTWYVASEAKMLEWVMHRNKVSKIEIVDIPEGKLFSYPLQLNKEIKEVPIPEKKYSTYQTSGGTTRTTRVSTGEDYDSRYFGGHSGSRSATRALDQRVIVEIEDWWKMKGVTSYDNTKRASVESYCVMAKVHALVYPRITDVKIAEGDTIIITGVREEVITNLVENDFCMAQVDVRYGTTRLWLAKYPSDKEGDDKPLHEATYTKPSSNTYYKCIDGTEVEIIGANGITNSLVEVAMQSWERIVPKEVTPVTKEPDKSIVATVPTKTNVVSIKEKVADEPSRVGRPAATTVKPALPLLALCCTCAKPIKGGIIHILATETVCSTCFSLRSKVITA